MALAPVPARATWRMSLGSFRWSAGISLASLDAPARPLGIEIDPGRIEPVLVDVIDSAIEYSPGGVEVVGLGQRDGAGTAVTTRLPTATAAATVEATGA
jgi:signal transduction histidine kinase